MKQSYVIVEIEKEVAISFIHCYHYSKILPRLTKYYLGVYNEKGLVGVLTLGWGTQPLQTIRKIFPEHAFTTADYLEIGKMCFLPAINANRYSGSQILSALVKWMRKNTDCLFLYTLADGIMGKVGYVYQAANFHYLGFFKTSVYMDKRTKEKIHPRSARSLCEENAKWEGKEKVSWLTHDFCAYKEIDKINGKMFRYIFPLNKKGKKILKSHPEYQHKSYPKACDLVFERRIAKGKFQKIGKPDFNMDIFYHNYQKP